MNKVILMGRLTRDPEIRDSVNGKVARYTLAIDRRGREKEADYPQIVCFGKSAEWAEKWLKKGKKIAVTGRIQTSKYQDKQTGKMIYNTDVIAEDQEFAESKSKETQDEFVPLPDSAEMPFR